MVQNDDEVDGSFFFFLFLLDNNFGTSDLCLNLFFLYITSCLVRDLTGVVVAGREGVRTLAGLDTAALATVGGLGELTLCSCHEVVVPARQEAAPSAVFME